MTSVYELTTPLGAERKQRFWDYFDGNGLRNWWTFTDEVGTNSGAMVDAVNGGYAITTSTASNDKANINFNDIRHYDFDGAVLIGTTERITATSAGAHIILTSDKTLPSSGQQAHYRNDTLHTNLAIFTRTGASTSTVEGTTANDTNRHTLKMEFTSSITKGWVDGDLEIAKTTDVPTGDKGQPGFRVITRTTAAATGRCTYLEAYNT